MQKKGWLGQRIEEARKEVDQWPPWMKATARFEGSVREDANEKPTNSSESTETSGPKKIST